MARFEWIGNTMVNVDKVRTCYRKVDEPDVLIVELDNGEVCKHPGKSCWMEEQIEGGSFIAQVIPCPKLLYARYKEDDGREYDYPVYYLALCADGYVRPLDIAGCDGVCFADDADNFVGLFSERAEKENDNEKISM